MSGILYGAQHTARKRCAKCGHNGGEDDAPVQLVSNYAQFVRKFAIGNGPPNSVASYYYSTESGKMLGTLVALAVARMTNLEIFFWDMPTGIVKEVWTALSSLGYTRRGKPKPSSLGSIWIRCHDSAGIRSPSQITYPDRPTQTFSAHPESLKLSYGAIEHPNFSILPPLGKIGVVEIDELAYFEELAILIEKSQPKLRELRIGAARSSRLVAADSIGPGYVHETTDTCLGAGGVLGLLLSRIHDCRQHVSGSPKSLRRQEAVSNFSAISLAGISSTPLVETHPTPGHMLVPADGNAEKPIGDGINLHPVTQAAPVEAQFADNGRRDNNDAVPLAANSENAREESPGEAAEKAPTPQVSRAKPSVGEDQLEVEEKRLRLRVLELENLMIPSFVLRHAIDWSTLTNLTLLNCALDEEFWGDLRAIFAPTPKLGVTTGMRPTALTHDFPLKLRKVHVDGVSANLICTLRDCLAPDTLECLFLQDRKSFGASSKVTVDAIFRGPLRRHRGSLQKLSIDSMFKHPHERSSYEKWILTKGVLAFIFSGKMPRLRELAVSIRYEDWHYLLQNLPNLPRLRSLYIPFIRDYPSAPSTPFFNAKEAALQVLDIVTLRPEIEICYIGIQNKCFEILEGRKAEEYDDEVANGAPMASSTPGATDWGDPLRGEVTSDDSDDEEVFVPRPPVPPAAGGQRVHVADAAVDDGEDAYPETDSGSEEDSGAKGQHEKTPKLRLREILFYTEKVEIFKVERGTIVFST